MRAITTVLVGLGLALSPLSGMLQAGEGSKPLKIGIVNIKKVFDDYKKKMDREVALQKERNELQAELDKKEKELKKLEKEMEILEGDQKLKKKEEFDEKMKDYTAFFSYNNKKLQAKQVELWNTIHNEIVDEIDRFGKKHGYDLILKSDPDPIRGKSLEEIQLRADIKKVLYHSGKVDLTEPILKILNDQYKKLKESKEKSS
jgi:Skp family chaperone for outer membrane proteins